MIRLSDLLAAGPAPRGRKRGSRSNPFRGKRTLGPSLELLNHLVEWTVSLAMEPVYDTRPNHRGELVEGFVRFPPRGQWVLDNLSLLRADGRGVRFFVIAVSDPDVPSFTGGVGRYVDGWSVIVIHLPAGGAFDRDSWARWARAFYAHELTHLMDPGRDRQKGALPSTRGDEPLPDPTTREAWAGYRNDPAEVIAYRHEVVQEMRDHETLPTRVRLWRQGGRDVGAIVPLAMLMSSTWREIRRELTPANRRRIQEAAAVVVQEWLDGASAG